MQFVQHGLFASRQSDPGHKAAALAAHEHHLTAMGIHIGPCQLQTQSQAAGTAGIFLSHHPVHIPEEIAAHAAAPVSHRKHGVAILPLLQGNADGAPVFLCQNGVGQQVQHHAAHPVGIHTALHRYIGQTVMQFNVPRLTIGPHLFQQIPAEVPKIHFAVIKLQLAALHQRQLFHIAGHPQKPIKMQLQDCRGRGLLGRSAVPQQLGRRHEHTQLPIQLPGHKQPHSGRLDAVFVAVDGEQGDLDAVAVLPGLGPAVKGLSMHFASEGIRIARQRFGNQPCGGGILQKIIQVPAAEILLDHQLQRAAGIAHPAGGRAQQIGFRGEDMLPEGGQPCGFFVLVHERPSFPRKSAIFLALIV